MQLVLTSPLLLQAYRQGLFPMAYSADSPYIHWVCPEMRGVLPIADLHIPRRLAKTVRGRPYNIRINTAFNDVIESCAAAANTRPETWINEPIIEAYTKLHREGHAHSVECWDKEELVGGLYGLSIGGAFFGESMFSSARDASKIVLVHLAARLWRAGYSVLDTQFVNDHLQQFGIMEVPHEDYLATLNSAVEQETDFYLKGINEGQLIRDYFKMRG